MDISNASLLDLMPPNLAADRNVRMVSEAFDAALREIIGKIQNVAVIPNLVLNQIADETLIDLLAWQFHVDFYKPEMPLAVKRELVLKSLDWHFRKGTPSVVEEIVSTVFSKAEVQEWHEYGGLPYHFQIILSTEEPFPSQEVLDNFFRAVRSVKNTRSFLETLKPIVAFFEDASVGEKLQIVRAEMAFADLWKVNDVRYDGRYKHDGTATAGRVIKDRLSITAKPGDFADAWQTGIKHNGMIAADGTCRYGGHGPVADIFSVGVNYGYQDNAEIADKGEAMIATDLGDYFTTQILYNGAHKHDGKALARGAREALAMAVQMPLMADSFETALKHNGMICADGSHSYGGKGGISDLPATAKGRLSFGEAVPASDELAVWIMQRVALGDLFPTRFLYDGRHKHDGAMRGSGAREELAARVKEKRIEDAHRAPLKHNGAARADGTHAYGGMAGIGDVLEASETYSHRDKIDAADEGRAKISARLIDPLDLREEAALGARMPLSDGAGMEEGFTIGMRYSRKHDGAYLADGSIQYNSGKLIPL